MKGASPFDPSSTSPRRPVRIQRRTLRAQAGEVHLFVDERRGAGRQDSVEVHALILRAPSGAVNCAVAPPPRAARRRPRSTVMPRTHRGHAGSATRQRRNCRLLHPENDDDVCCGRGMRCDPAAAARGAPSTGPAVVRHGNTSVACFVANRQSCPDRARSSAAGRPRDGSRSTRNRSMFVECFRDPARAIARGTPLALWVGVRVTSRLAPVTSAPHSHRRGPALGPVPPDRDRAGAADRRWPRTRHLLHSAREPATWPQTCWPPSTRWRTARRCSSVVAGSEANLSRHARDRRDLTGMAAGLAARRASRGPARARRGGARVDARLVRRDALRPRARRADGRPRHRQVHRGPARVLDAGRVGRRRHPLRRRRRPLRPHARADCERADLLGVHRRLRPGAERAAARGVPRLPRHRDGRGMGERRGARLRDVAGRASRQGARPDAERVGDRLRPGRRGQR